jgi:hypothetical protein
MAGSRKACLLTSGQEIQEGRMNSGRADGNPASKHTAPKPSVEELTELVRDLYELLQGYAPWWSTKGMDARVSETLARFTPPRGFPQDVDRVRTTAPSRTMCSTF